MDNDKLNNKEIDDLKELFKNRFNNSFIDNYSRKYYNLFFRGAVFEPDNCSNNSDDLYYLGVYHQYCHHNCLIFNCIISTYQLSLKYYSLAVEKGNSNAMYNLAIIYYIPCGNDGDNNNGDNNGDNNNGDNNVAKKYLLMAASKGNVRAMALLGNIYEIEKDYFLMEKYYIMATDKGDADAMYYLGHYYLTKENNQYLTDKYFLMAMENGCVCAVWYIGEHLDIYSDYTQNYFTAIIKSNIRFNTIRLFVREITENKDDMVIDLFCCAFKKNNIKYLSIENFNFCVYKIISYVSSYREYTLTHIKYFMKYILILYHSAKQKDKKRRDCIKNIFRNNYPQIFMEYLDLHYYKYLEKVYTPGGKGYIKTKNHFELIAKQQ
jgi:hypothetical protein